MCKIPARLSANCVRRSGDALNGKCLTGCVIHAANHDERQRVAGSMNRFQDVFFADQRFTGSRCYFQHFLRGIKTARPHVRMHCVCIAGKCAALHDDLGALAFGAPETHHHEMEIDRQRIHHHHFAGACAN